MSDPIQSISQSNYILATQQEVSHDNTLSGNGTVDSPLGVVPGYNETVLYNYPSSENIYNTSRKLISFSESCRNFERIRIYIVNNDGAMGIAEFEPGSTDHTETFQLNTISNEPRLYVKMTTWVLDANTLTYRAGAHYYVSNGATSLTDATVNKTINYVVPYKVIGINRKA